MACVLPERECVGGGGIRIDRGGRERSHSHPPNKGLDGGVGGCRANLNPDRESSCGG